MSLRDKAAAAVVIACAMAMAGCSTWRCRGFLDAYDMPTDRPRANYVLESIEFLRLAAVGDQVDETSPRLQWLSRQDAMAGASYLADISRETGFTNATSDAVSVKVVISPMAESKVGWDTVAWPLCCTLGVFPAHFAESVPFDVIVLFGKDGDVAHANLAQIRIDHQVGLSRFDMDAPPPAPGAVGECRDDGSIGTGRGLRPERMRDVFVKVVAAAVMRAVAHREGANCERVIRPATEFGLVEFGDPSRDRDNYTGLSAAPPKMKPAVAEVTDQERLRRAWDSPRNAEERSLKDMVESGFMSKDEWSKKILERPAE